MTVVGTRSSAFRADAGSAPDGGDVELTRAGASGANRFSFNGTIGGHNLGPGTYELIAIPAGGAPRNVTFTIVP